MTGIDIAALSSIGAGAIHAAAAGIHAENPMLSRLFVLTAAAQILVGLVLLLRRGRPVAIATIVVNAGAVTAWAVTRTVGISWIDGLEQSETPGFADTVCATLGALAVIGAVVALVRHTTNVRHGNLVAPGVALGALSLVAMMIGATDVHSHGEEAGHAHTEDVAATEEADHAHTSEPATTEHAHTSEPATTEHAHDGAAPAEPAALAWPRAWDPTAPIDFSGVAGVTAEQQARAETLVASTLRDLPAFADVTTIGELGFQSIGDESTGFEHFLNIDNIRDDSFLDPTRPESLVYQVDGDTRTLVSAMFIAKDNAIDDPELVGWGGPLMQWHVHENLCWGLDESGQPKVVGLTDAEGKCEPGSVNAGGRSPMVHVWIAPHECGPFAALEGHGAGQAATEGKRVDQCAHGHGEDPAAETAAYDPTKPIDLSGVDGVTAEQQAYAENLVAVTVVRLPQWSDPAVAEAAGFRSIGDASTGHEHYINWAWLDDDVWLDPDAPESLVYEPQPDGTKKLVSAMYMLPQTVALADVPNGGGQLMQWHVHDNLCYTDDPEAPQVAGLTRAGGACRPPLVTHPERPMIHVWITPHPCGPFAALEGVGAGSIPEGEERWCDHVHGS